MANEERHKFTVISNNIDIKTAEREHERERERGRQPENRSTNEQFIPSSEYHTNPMYEKLLNFSELQKKKRFTVEDLLKW